MPLHFGSPWLLALVPIGIAFVLWARRGSFVNLPPQRLVWSTTLRLLLVAVLAFVAAEPIVVSLSRVGPTVLLVDVSASVPDALLAAERAFASRAWTARGRNTVEVVTFAGHARHAVVGPDGPTIERHDEGDTNFAEAIALARGLVPARAPHLVLLSDGNDSRGTARQAVERAAAEGVVLDVARLDVGNVVDARVTALSVPDVVRRQEPTRVSIIVESTVAGRATIRFEENGFLIEELADRALKPGQQSFDVDFVPAVAGLVRYSAQVVLPADAVPGNNRFSELVSVGGPPRILLAASTPEEGMHLEEALAAQEIQVEAVSPGSLPSTLEGLLAYDEVILAGTAPWEIDRLRQGALASYVRDTGGGLLFVSGRRGLTRDPEGRPSALETILPVELTQPSEKQEPPVAILLLIDRSGSMVGEKLDYAKQAARAVVDKLTPHDQVGVIAFDASFEWIVPLRTVDDKQAVETAIGSLGAGGGTRFFPALEEGYFALGSAPAAVRHIILLTDGVSTDPTDIFAPLLTRARSQGITVSSVAIGHGADVKLLGSIAHDGGGRFNLATRASEVPDLFVKETETVQRDAAHRADTKAQLVTASRELAGIDFATAPPLLGYLSTRSKATAEVLLESPRHDPLLARWRYGLGDVLAFTSDATAAWATQWLTWPGFGKLWAQLARSAQRPRARHDLDLSLRIEDERLVLTVRATDADGRLLDDLDVKVHVIDGAEEAHEVSLPQIGPGRYETRLAVAAGSVLARPFGSRGGRRLEGGWAMLPRPYPRELARVGVDEAGLARLAALGRGQLIDDVTSLGGPVPARLQRTLPLTLPLTLLAFLLFLVDVVVKRARWEGR